MKKMTLVLLLMICFQYPAFSSEHLVETRHFEWNGSTQEFILSNKVIKNYYDNNLLKESITFKNENASLLLSSKHEYIYDSNGNEIENNVYNYENDRWKLYSKTISTYNEEGSITYSKYSIYNPWFRPAWRDYFQSTYTYESGNLISVIDQKCIDSLWINEDKTVYTYDIENRIESESYSTWEDGDWFENNNEIYSYDSKDRIFEIIKTDYRNQNTKTRTTKTFDNNDNILLEYYQKWNDTDSIWESAQQQIFYYDEHNNQTMRLYQFWHSEESHLTNFFRLSYRYNTENKLIFESTSYYNDSSATWEEKYKAEYDYSMATELERNNELVSEYKLSNNYPNPFNPSTVISFSIPDFSNVKLTVHNVLGEIVSILVNGEKPAGEYKYTFDGSGLASGMYFYKLEANGFVEVKKMILLK